MAGKPRNLKGRVFGVLSVQLYLGGGYWTCTCACGKFIKVRSDGLLCGDYTSCGCLKAQRGRKRFTTHGLSKTHTYKVWESMLQRCTNPNFKHWCNYGGRGVIVCERWVNFENFYADMGECPEGLTLDRINNNGNYEPGNCRWATRKEQQSNRRGNILFQDTSTKEVFTCTEALRRFLPNMSRSAALWALKKNAIPQIVKYPYAQA